TLAVVSLLAPAYAGAQCTTSKDVGAVRKSATLAAKCNYGRLRSGPLYVCKSSPPPSCAGSLVADSIALAWGINNPAPSAVDKIGLRNQIKCQKAISTGVVNFIGNKLRYLTKGFTDADAEAKARHSIDKIPTKCLVTVAEDTSGIVVPDVGPQMDAAVPGPPG